MSAAGTYCKDRFATLIPVTDVDVVAMVKEYYPDTSLYWTAGYYENSSAINGWVWMDQGYNSIQDVAQLNFDMNVYHKSLLESTTASSGMCVALMNGNPLRIRNCTLAFKLICSRKHHSRICPPGYGASGSRCLSLGQYNHTHTEAESICANRFGQLFEPRTLMDLQDIYNLATEYNWNKYDLRVGITYKNNAWRFASDGAQIPADLWSSNYPLMQVNKTCALYNATTKKLVNAGCNDLQYYICIYNSKPHCPAGFLSFGWSSECYMIAPFKLPYPSSASYCKMWGGEIATIRENYTKTQVNDLQYNRMDAVSNIYLWVDLQDTTYDGMYQFSDGTMMRGVTLSSTGGNCFYLYTSNIYATSCSNSASIQPLCMAKKGDCPMGFLNRGNSCYRFSNEQRYYDVSAIYCGYYSSLLSWTFNSSVLVNGLSAKGYQPVKSTGTPYWMGGQFNTTIGMWILSNNANVTYPSSGSLLGGLWEANNPVVGDVCMVLNSQGRLESKTCGTNNTNRFICETTKNQIGMNLPRHDFPILQPTCFMENQYDPQFRISPGNYDPEKLSLTLCKGRCLALGFNYAGATYGKYCFCSNILTLEAVSSNMCNKSCSSSASSEICGSVDGKYITVIRVGSSATSGQLKDQVTEEVDGDGLGCTGFWDLKKLLRSFDDMNDNSA
ncbi:uncharacterized protein [Macrobrachium rosenbergii]|uniref:uncharacterized protein n=1 Tax=Macrobrachium rosenbergii TaxID=79674 RepID=UPI0034D6CA6D